MLDGLLKKFGSPFFHLCRHAHEFVRKVSNKNREVKQNDSQNDYVPIHCKAGEVKIFEEVN